jgi:hypothetical protein
LGFNCQLSIAPTCLSFSRQSAIVRNLQFLLTLHLRYQADGTTEIDITDSPSSLVQKSTKEHPLVVKSVASTPTASFPTCQIPFYQDICDAEEQGSWLLFNHTIPYLNFTAEEHDAAEEPDTVISDASEESDTVTPRVLDRLFVRDSSKTIATRILRGVNKNIITGTPGIGKSLFLIYLLWRLVKDKKRVLFVYHPDTVYYDGQGGIFHCPKSLPSYNEVAFWSADLWCLVDARDKETRDLRAFSYGMCKFVLSTSPRREMVNNFRKSPPHRVFDMPLWTETELETIASCFTVKKKDWLPRFKVLGGIPRHVLEDTQHEPT